MSVEKRDFSNFYLGDDVRELANGVIPVAADFVGVTLPEKPVDEVLSPEMLARDQAELSEGLGVAVGKLGKDKVLRNNEEISVHPGIMGGLVQSAGTQKSLARSLWAPEDVIDGSEDEIVVTGAVAPWQQRVLGLLAARAERGDVPQSLNLIAGNRVMKGATDVTEQHVREFQMRHNGELPTESQYVEEVIVPKAQEAGFKVRFVAYETGSGSAIADKFTSSHPEMFVPGKKIIFVRVANAGIQLACQFRAAARSGVNPKFDADPNNPQAYILTDTHPVGFTGTQATNPKEFQSPYTGARQMMVTAKLLHEAQ